MPWFDVSFAVRLVFLSVFQFFFVFLRHHPLIRDPPNKYIPIRYICFVYVDWVSSVDIWPIRLGVTDTCLCVAWIRGVAVSLFGFAGSCSCLVWTFGATGAHFLALRTLSPVWLCR